MTDKIPNSTVAAGTSQAPARRGPLVAIDYGSKRIGLAVSDPDGIIASPLATYERQDAARDAAYFQKVIAEHQPKRLVVGMPLHLDGREGQKAQEVRAFAQWLGTFLSAPIVFFDERFTTVEAESALWNAGLTHGKRKARRDRVAAQILLQSYLDAGCPESPELGPLGDSPGT